MFTDRLSDYFEGVAAKYLTAVDINPKKSNQHEIGGLIKAGLSTYLGEPQNGEKWSFPAKLVYLEEDSEELISCEANLTWYDTRYDDPDRSAEYRLYYPSNLAIKQATEGDFFLIAKMRDGSLLLVFAPRDGQVEHQLRSLFGLPELGKSLKGGQLDAIKLHLPLRLLLEEIGLDIIPEDQGDDIWLGKLLEHFGGQQFPDTSRFSGFARQTISGDVDPLGAPDDTLLAWMDHEEKLFRLYERHLVEEKLRMGFGPNGDDVDEFISFSLSVQNRRKSRVGHAFEGHLDTLFRLHGLRFEQGRGKGKVTENNAKPDFLFPDFASYHNPTFPTDQLHMLGAKTTCKDRWRQVLSEAKRIERKHLITLEAAISETQTEEMKSHGLQLVIPAPLHATYSAKQQKWLSSLYSFIKEVRT